MNKKMKTFLIILVVAALAVGAYFLIKKQKEKKAAEAAANDMTSVTGEELVQTVTADTEAEVSNANA